MIISKTQVFGIENCSNVTIKLKDFCSEIYNSVFDSGLKFMYIHVTNNKTKISLKLLPSTCFSKYEKSEVKILDFDIEIFKRYMHVLVLYENPQKTLSNNTKIKAVL